MIVQGAVEKEWLPIENSKGVVRVGAIVGMKVEGKPDSSKETESEQTHQTENAGAWQFQQGRRSAAEVFHRRPQLERRIH